jgi:hypothetical protein
VTAYYERHSTVNTDGTPVFEQPVDDLNERRVKARLEAAWNCTLHRYPRLHGVDWYAERDQRLTAHVELKTRHHPADQFPTVMLNMRKYLTLFMAEIGTGVPSLFVVAYSCGTVKWRRVADIDPSGARIGGTKHIVKSTSDREPILYLPVHTFNDL